MKKFVRILLSLAGVLFLLNVVLDYSFTSLLNHSHNHPYREWNRITHDSIDADLVVIGSSRAWVQYSPRVMDSLLGINTYNLGLDGSHVGRQIVKYQVYRHYQKKKPSILLFNFDYWGNWQESDFLRMQYFPYLANPYMRGLLKKQEHFGKGELCVPMFRYYQQGIRSLMEAACGEEMGYKGVWYKGYKGILGKWDGEKYAEIEKVRFKPFPVVVEKFDVFMSELQKDGIKVVFVSSPIYIGLTEKLVNLSEFYDFRKSFAQKYNIPVLDYLYDSLCYDTAYFYNATHLNKTGSELFTVKLCHDLDSLGVLQQ